MMTVHEFKTPERIGGIMNLPNIHPLRRGELQNPAAKHRVDYSAEPKCNISLHACVYHIISASAFPRTTNNTHDIHSQGTERNEKDEGGESP